MSRYFPLFVNLEGKKIWIYGAGEIASRRISALFDFGCELTVIAPKASEKVESLFNTGKLVWRQEEYSPGEIPADVCLILAATDQKEINAQIGAECKKKKILVNVCSDKNLCDFYFPGLAVNGNLVAGVTAGGEDHKRARAATEKVQAVVKEM